MKRSDSLQALIFELVDLDRTLVAARAAAEVARQEFVAARQALDNENAKVAVAEQRRVSTRGALDIIQGRDNISDETVDALIARAEGQ